MTDDCAVMKTKGVRKRRFSAGEVVGLKIKKIGIVANIEKENIAGQVKSL